MQALAPDLWIDDAPLRFLGVDVGARMTAVRLTDGTLWLHSPLAAEPERVRAVGELGRVAHLVAPNRFHHLFVGEWRKAFPDAAIHVAPGLATKRPDLEVASALGDRPEPAWADHLDQVALAGFPLANEVVFFHRASATLIASDLAFNVGPEAPPLTRLLFRLGGVYGRLTPTLLERLGVRDRDAFRRSLVRVLDWPFERVVVAHGRVAESGGREALRRGYAWLFEGAPDA